MKRRLCPAGPVCEEVGGIQCIVAQKFECRTVELIRAAFRYDADLAACAAPEFRSRNAGLNGKLLHRIGDPIKLGRWNAFVLPDGDDDVTIPNSATITVNSDSRCRNLSLPSSSAVNFNGSGAVMLATSSLSSGMTLGGSSMFVVLDEFNWLGGTMSGSGRTVIAAGATFNLNSSAVHFLSGGRTLENGGTILWSAGSLTMGGVTITNRPGALFDNQTATTVNSGGGNRFDNAGTFRKSLNAGIDNAKTATATTAIDRNVRDILPPGFHWHPATSAAVGIQPCRAQRRCQTGTDGLGSANWFCYCDFDAGEHGGGCCPGRAESPHCGTVATPLVVGEPPDDLRHGVCRGPDHADYVRRHAPRAAPVG